MDFVNRLKFFMENGGITISQFADTCRIPRPTMSQILNGRNKKISDELIAKIHAAYPELSVLWLMFGEGSMTTPSNTQLSEAENGANSAASTSQRTVEQAVGITQSSPNGLFENPQEKSKQEKTLFDEDNATPTHTSPNKILENTDAVNERRQYYVRTHELIEFDTDNPATVDNTTEVPVPEIPTEKTNAPNIRQTSCENNPTDPSSATSSVAESGKRNISLSTAADKRITNIVVFYSDNSFQSFYPTVF